MNNNFNSPDQVIENIIGIQTKKTSAKMSKLIILGILAGMYIGFGASASNAVMHTTAGTGIARLLGGSVFPVGLMLIVITGGELFTGDCLMITALLDKKCRIISALRVLLTVWLANLAGGILAAFLAYMSGQFGMSGGLLGAYTIKVALSKCLISPAAAVFSGILCNIFVCGAVLMASAARDIVGKILGIFFPIMAFVLCGFEHCVANMYYIPAGLFAAQNSGYVSAAAEEYGLTEEMISSGLNTGNFLLRNILPVTAGNIIGGMLFVGASLYYVFAEKKSSAKE